MNHTDQYDDGRALAIEERLRAALHARADLVQDTRVAPPLPEAVEMRRWRGPLVAAAATLAVAASVAVAVGLGHGDEGEVQPAPAPPTGVPSGTGASGMMLGDAEARGDLDGDGIEDTVVVEGSTLVAGLSSAEPATTRVPRGSRLVGLADVGTDRLIVVVGHTLYKIGPEASFVEVQRNGDPAELLWVGAERQLLTGTSHSVGQQRFITAYRWYGGGRTLTPAADALHCPVDGAAPEPCGTGATFTGDAAGLPELEPLSWDGVGAGEGDVYPSQPGFGAIAARLDGSAAGEVGAGEVELVVDGVRLGLPAGPAPQLLNASFRTDDDALVVAVFRAIGDSHSYDLYRYDGETLVPVEVVETDGLGLDGGGPALGGPYTEVFPGMDGSFYSLRAESGINLFQTAVRWTWDGDRLIGESLGIVCLDSLVRALDVEGAYGDCGLP